eukprot:g72511.t1
MKGDGLSEPLLQTEPAFGRVVPKRKPSALSLCALLSLACLGFLLIARLVFNLSTSSALLASAPSQRTYAKKKVVELLDHAPKNKIAALTPREISQYQEDGYLLVRGLLSRDEAEALRDDALTAMRKESSLKDWVMTAYEKMVFDTWRKRSLFAQLALQRLPALARQLMGHNCEGSCVKTIRVLRDALFSYKQDKSGCGWHVDDAFFWPTANDTGGVNMWIALDEMRVSEGGGLAVAKGTHQMEPWVQECLHVIRTTGTCTMQKFSPECHKRMEAIKVQWDMHPGDAILWDRWLFHRAVTFEEMHSKNDKSPGFSGDTRKMRYSVRYIPGHATAEGVVHPSVKQGDTFEGSPYYPQVWPAMVPAEVEAIEAGLADDVTTRGMINAMWKMALRKLLGRSM